MYSFGAASKMSYYIFLQNFIKLNTTLVDVEIESGNRGCNRKKTRKSQLKYMKISISPNSNSLSNWSKHSSTIMDIIKYNSNTKITRNWTKNWQTKKLNVRLRLIENSDLNHQLLKELYIPRANSIKKKLLFFEQ